MGATEKNRLAIILVGWAILTVFTVLSFQEDRTPASPAPATQPVVAAVPPAGPAPSPVIVNLSDADAAPTSAGAAVPPALPEELLSGPPANDIFVYGKPASSSNNRAASSAAPRSSASSGSSRVSSSGARGPVLPPLTFTPGGQPLVNRAAAAPAPLIGQAASTDIELLGVAQAGSDSACLLKVGKQVMYLRSGDSFPTAAGDGRIVSVRDNKVRLVTPTGNVNLTTSSVRTTRVVAQTSPQTAAGGGSVAAKPDVSSSGRYTVQKGDNLWRISMRLYGTPHIAAQIAKANGLRNASVIVIGQSLALPGAASTGPVPVAKPVVQVATPKKPVSTSSTNVSNPAKPSNVVVKPSNEAANKSGEVVLYKVKPGDTLYGISRKFYGSHFDAGKIAKANNLGNPNKLKPDSVLRIQLP